MASEEDAGGVGHPAADLVPLTEAGGVSTGVAGTPAWPVQPYEALTEEKQVVLADGGRHPELWHRELARRMVD